MNEKKRSISILELKALMDAQKVIVIDIRTVEEFEEGHIWNSIHRPIDSLPNSVRDLPEESLLITVCNKGGGRSERAAEILRAAGWKNVNWLEGGYLGWVEAGLPDYEPGFVSS